MTLRELIIKIAADTKDYDRKLVSATTQIRSFGAEAEKVGSRLSLAVTAPLVGLGAAAVKTAGEMEQTKTAFTTLLKSADAANSHLEKLKQFTLVTPYQFEDVTRMSRLMQAYGTAASDVVPKLKILGNAASALGGGNDLLERIVRSVGEIGTRGKITGEQLRELGRAGIPALEALASKMGVTAAEAQAKVTAGMVDAKTATDALMEYMERRFAGGMEAQSKTVLGSWSNVKDKITFTMAEIGAALLPIAKDAIGNIDSVLGTVKDLAKGFGELPRPIQDATLALAGLTAGAPLAVVGLGILISNTATVAAAFTKMAPAMVAAKAGMLSFVESMGVANMGFQTIGRNYAAQVATGLFRVTAWAALAVEVWNFANAWRDASKASDDADKSNRGAADSLARLETYLRQNGADISALSKEYHSGAIAYAEYLKGLRDVGNQMVRNRVSTGDLTLTTEVANAAVEALGLKSVASRKKEYEETKRYYDQIAAAYGKGSIVAQEAAQKVTAAHEALYGVTEKVKVSIVGIPFAEKSKEAAILAERYRDSVEAMDAVNKDAARIRREIAEGKLGYAAMPTPPAEYVRTYDELWAAINKTSKESEALALSDESLQRSIDAVLQPSWELADALQAFGLKDASEQTAQLSHHFDVLNANLEDGTLDVNTYLRAWLKMMEAADAAGEEIDAATKREYLALKNQLGGGLKEAGKETSQLSQDIHRAFRSFETSIAKNIVEWKGWGESIQSIGQSAAEGLLKIFLAKLFNPLEDKLASLATGIATSLKSLLGGSTSSDLAASGVSSAVSAATSSAAIGTQVVASSSDVVAAGSAQWDNIASLINGSAATAASTATTAATTAKAATSVASTASSTASTATSAAKTASGTAKAASSAISSVLGTVGAVSSAISAITGVIGVFQSARQETTLNAIEESTRYTKIYIGGQADSVLETIHKVFASADQIRSYLWDVQATYLQKICAAVESGTAGSGAMSGSATFQFFNCNFGSVTQQTINSMMDAAFKQYAVAYGR